MEIMKKFLFWFVGVLVPLVGATQVVSSNVVSSAGDNYQNNYATMQVTIGEIITETISENGVTMTQGFQQTDIIVKPEIVDEQSISIVNVYPNPAVHSIKIDFGGNPFDDCVFELLNNKGQRLMSASIRENITEIPLSQFVAGIYHLRVHSTKSNYKQSFTIEKL